MGRIQCPCEISNCNNEHSRFANATKLSATGTLHQTKDRSAFDFQNYQIHRKSKKHVEEDYLVLNGAQKSINEYINNRPESWNFAFYKIFDHDSNQDEIFQNVAQPVVQSVLNGYNATIFAYGQTGSGKTYSVTGDPKRYDDRGVLPRTVQYLFEIIKKNPDNLYFVEIAYLEIYNENGYDLLDPKHEVVTKLEDLPRVTIQEDETGKLHLKNLIFRRVENEKDALALLFLGDTNRAISETPMNPQSSRSHCIFTIAVSVKQSGTEHLTKAKMHLVDLAGSERVYKCCISGTILTEAKYINLSLHYLEQVIVCLGQQNVGHIPYRNSLLTAILRDSLGGNCLTTMLATLSLNTSNFEETISTCRFSQRVALIKNDVNLVFEKNPEDENRFLKIEVERLRNQIAELTKPVITGELTPNEKQKLNFQVGKFLDTNATIDWANDDRKIKYCFQVLREKLKTQNGDKCVEVEPGKDFNYYRNLVVQRDKEISALINMLKKTRRNSSSNSAGDPGTFKADENQNETSPRMSVIRKKVRPRDLKVEAKSIAELIKNGKASIGDLETRMTNVYPIKIQDLNKNLQIEQSRLAPNPSSLKTFNSEAKDSKNASIVENESQKNFVADVEPENLSEKSSTPRVSTSSKKFYPPKSRGNHEDDETIRIAEPFKILTSIPKQTKSLEGQNQEIKKREIVANSLVKMSENSVEVLSPENEIDDEEVQRNSASRSKINSQKNRNDINSQRISVGERFIDTKTLPNGESRRSSFRAPAFLRDMLRSERDSDAGFESSLMSEKDDDLDLTQPIKNFRGNLSGSDSDEYKCYDEIHDRSITDQEFGEKDSENFDSRVPKAIFDPDENSESNLMVEDDSIIVSEDDSFMKSLPLTGDPEIDDEIIAFYQAKRSGETY